MKALAAGIAILLLLLVGGCAGTVADSPPAAGKSGAGERTSGDLDKHPVLKPMEWPVSMRGKTPAYDLPLDIQIDVPEVPRDIAEPAAKFQAEKAESSHEEAK